MGIKLQLLESAKVYDINNLKGNPIAELEPGTPVEVENILKSWKAWYKLTLPDGRIGVFSVLTKVQNLGFEAPKAGGWSNFSKILQQADPHKFGFDIMDCINEYEPNIVKHIQTDKSPEGLILGCNRVGADHFLEEQVVNNSVINVLLKNARKNNMSAIQTLIKIENIQKRHLISDELIKWLKDKTKSSGSFEMATFAGFLVDIAIIRKSVQLVDEIIDIYRNSKYPYVEFQGFRLLHNIPDDNRVIDFLISQLSHGFRLEDKYAQVNNLSDMFIKNYRWGPAHFAAEELLAIGDSHGIYEIIPNVLAFVAGEHIKNIYKYNLDGGGGHLGNPELREWVVDHSLVFFPYLIEGLNYKNAEARCFAINCVMNIGNPEGVEAIKKLRNDPDKKIRQYVEDVLAYNKIT